MVPFLVRYWPRPSRPDDTHAKPESVGAAASAREPGKLKIGGDLQGEPIFRLSGTTPALGVSIRKAACRDRATVERTDAGDRLEGSKEPPPGFTWQEGGWVLIWIPELIGKSAARVVAGYAFGIRIGAKPRAALSPSNSPGSDELLHPSRGRGDHSSQSPFSGADAGLRGFRRDFALGRPGRPGFLRFWLSRLTLMAAASSVFLMCAA